MRDDRAWLLDILEALLNIEKYAAKGERAFYDEELIQVWIIYYIQVAGEAANKLSDSFKKNHTNIPWKGIIGMRNVLVHQYFGLDREVVCRIFCKIDGPVIPQVNPHPWINTF
ncbi:MAG: HepT-like ribonuclease domain-containing protein [Methanothrix sp.]